MNKKVFSTADSVADYALELILEKSAYCIWQKGSFVLSLAGGSTPSLLYQKLAHSHQDWSKWQLLYGDERHLPYGDKNRNDHMVKTQWLEQINFPEQQHHRIPYSDNINDSAKQYNTSIESLPDVDFALLGMGEDGHTASLFPENISHDQRISTTVAVTNAPKLPNERISLSYQQLNKADTVCFIITGEGKRQALSDWQAGNTLPVSCIAGKSDTYLLLDKAANID